MGIVTRDDVAIERQFFHFGAKFLQLQSWCLGFHHCLLCDRRTAAGQSNGSIRIRYRMQGRSFDSKRRGSKPRLIVSVNTERGGEETRFCQSKQCCDLEEAVSQTIVSRFGREKRHYIVEGKLTFLSRAFLHNQSSKETVDWLETALLPSIILCFQLLVDRDWESELFRTNQMSRYQMKEWWCGFCHSPNFL